MSSDHFDDIWDEHQWESHLNQIENNNEKLRGLLDDSIGEDQQPRWYKILKESPSEEDALDAFIEEELMFDEAYLPDDDDEWDADEDDFEDDFFGLIDDTEFDSEDFGFESDDDLIDADDDEDLDDGEDWKVLSEQFAMSDYGSIENLKIYTEAHKLGTSVLEKAEFRKQFHRYPAYNLLISDILQISAKIAAGYALGFDRDVMGGNIAYCKKALGYANRALNTLQNIKSRGIFNKADYLKLHREIFQVRNDLGIYIQELREKFYGNDPNI